MNIYEHYETAFEQDIDLKEIYLDQVWKILQDSYTDIGGLRTFKTPNDLLKSNNMWKMVTRNGKVVAVVIYKRRNGGRKLVAGGSDGTDTGKKDFYSICAEDVKMVDRKTWGEVSGALEGILLFKYDVVPIPAYIVEQVLDNMDLTLDSISKDCFHYVRDIANVPREKIMFGNVPKKYRLTSDWGVESNVYKQVFKMRNSEHPEELQLRKDKHK